MKKLGFVVMPLLTLSFLASCNNRNDCIVTAKDSEHLFFSTTEGRPLNGTSIEKNKDFTFNIKFQSSSRNEYKLPTTLDIYIGKSDIKLATGYTITETTYCFEATVTIEAIQITDRVTIVGQEVPLSSYSVDILTYGTNHDYQQKWVDVDKPLDIYFLEKDSLKLPEAENIYIKFDASDWINPLDEGSEEYFDFDQTTHRITILENTVRSNVAIRARSPEYRLLDDLSWSQISKYSARGWAPYMFYLGEEKTVPVDGLNHNVRIIGFNHDSTDLEHPDETKVGITFDFVEVISDKKGGLYTSWDVGDNNYHFPNSILNNFLNNNGDCVFNKLLQDLRDAIKEVDKPVFLDGASVKPYKAKLFPLSSSELGGGEFEGKQYEYYKQGNNKNKKPVGEKTDYCKYWLRSPTVGFGELAYFVKQDGAVGPNVMNGGLCASPGFCI